MALLIAMANAWWIVGLVLYFAASPAAESVFAKAGSGRDLCSEPVCGAAGLVVEGAQVADVARTRILMSGRVSQVAFPEPGIPLHRPGDILSVSVLLYPPRRGCWSDGARVWEDPRTACLPPGVPGWFGKIRRLLS